MKKTIAFESYPDYSNNSKIMYEYFVEKYPVEYNYIWIVYDIESKQTLSKLNVQTISPGDIDFQEKFINIDVIFSTHNFAAQYKKKHQTLFCLWHGGGFKKQGFFNDIDRENLTLYHQIDYFNSSSEYMATVFSATLALNIERFLTFGNPRSDILLNSDSKKNLEKIYNIKLSKYNKILIYLPTFRKSANRNEGYINEQNILNFDSYNEKEVLDFLEKNKYLLITKYHPAEESNHKTINNKHVLNLNDKILKDNDIPLEAILGACDLVISDYSSVYFDFLKMNKPVIFCHNDFEDYSSKRGILFDDYELWFPGPRVDNIKVFLEETEKLLNNSEYYQDQRNRTNRVINGKNQKPSRELIMNFTINKILNNDRKVSSIIGGQLKEEILKNIENKEKILHLNQELSEKRETIVSYEKVFEQGKLYRLATRIYKIKNKVFGGENE